MIQMKTEIAVGLGMDMEEISLVAVSAMIKMTILRLNRNVWEETRQTMVQCIIITEALITMRME